MAAKNDLTRIGSTPTSEPVHRCLDIDDGKGNRSMVALAGERMVIGRAAEVQIKVNAGGVSRRHAQLFTDPFGRWWIRDLGSANGTLVNSFRIEERLLELGDIVQIGDATLVVSAPNERLYTAQPTKDPAMPVRETQAGHISTLSRGAQPNISAAHLTTLMGFSRRLQSINNLNQRLRQLCSLMISEQFGGRSAVVIRLKRDDPSKPPQTLCQPQTAKHWEDDALYITKTMLETMRKHPESMLADDSEIAGKATGMNVAATPEAAAMSALACPLRTTDDEVDILYVMVPPTHGTMEWLTLCSLAAEQFCQMELNWSARRQARISALVEHDLSRGRDIQQRLIPKDVNIESFDVNISFLPCRWVAGDYVDVMIDSKRNKGILVIADVCGKGLPAALVASSLHTMVHTGLRAGASLLELVTLMNEHLYEHLPANRFVTGIFMEMDLDSGEVQYVNAGHPAPMVFSPDGQYRQMEMGDYEPLGLTNTKFSFLTDQIDPNHMMLMFTDGLIELKDQAGRMLTGERLADHALQIWARNPTDPLQLMADDLNKVLNEYQRDSVQLDDRTFMLVRKR
jgi:serine phosphatase RsbU (regulator of sigma subunit)